jgi:hypothetical protein
MKTSIALTLLAPASILAPPSRADLPQATCPQAWSDPVAVNFGAFEFDKDLTAGAASYGKHESFAWLAHTNTNVAHMNPHMVNWSSEVRFDYLRINNGFRFMGHDLAAQVPPEYAFDVGIECSERDGGGMPKGEAS